MGSEEMYRIDRPRRPGQQQQQQEQQQQQQQPVREPSSHSRPKSIQESKLRLVTSSASTCYSSDESSEGISSLNGTTTENNHSNNNAMDTNSNNNNSASSDDSNHLQGCGLMITTENDRLTFTLTGDENYPQIHPHVYAPHNMTDMKTLSGGGSGVAVFAGHHPSLGDLVMKHGNYKDLKELFALATIHQELQLRGNLLGNSQASLDMQRRLPEFKMIYISPNHIMEKRTDLWNRIRSLLKKWNIEPSSSSSTLSSSTRVAIKEATDEEENNDELEDEDEESDDEAGLTFRNLKNKGGQHWSLTDRRTSLYQGRKSWSLSDRMKSPVVQTTRDGGCYTPVIRRSRSVSLGANEQESSTTTASLTIHIYEGDDDDFTFIVDHESMGKQCLNLILPQGSIDSATSNRTMICVRGNAYEALHEIVEELDPIMEERLFKFTLAQKTIGGDSPKTGNQWLYERKLTGKVLDNLCTQMIAVIHHLEELTLPEEVDVVDLIRAEVDRFENGETHERANKLSSMADTFVGNAIVKNFHPNKGRRCILQELAAEFRDGTDTSFFLTEEEKLPAFHLGKLLKQGALMSATFEGMSMDDATTFLPSAHSWRNLLRRAVDDRPSMSRRSLQRIWTCGLADAGIHNLFVSEDDLYMFDLGEPQLQSTPGFLTKFLFSFFHTLGMEEDDQHGWVNRFRPVNLFGQQNQRLALTDETKQLLAHAYDAFETCLDRLVAEIFENDQGIRYLLLRYVTLQLLSDCAFCLEKWQIKGGGSKRDGTNHNDKGIEKWLWRALWDVYVVYDINTSESWLRLDVVHPHDFQPPDGK